MKPIAAVVSSLAATLALAAPALAAEDPVMPDPASHRITVPTSIGGVSLGEKLKQGNKTWGGEGKCATAVLPDSCFWGNFYDSQEGRAELEADEAGRIDFIQISWSGFTKHGKPQIRKEMTRFRAKEGVRLGSKLEAVKEAYPEAKPIKHGSNGRVQSWFIRGDGSTIYFGGGKFVNYISVVAPD